MTLTESDGSLMKQELVPSLYTQAFRDNGTVQVKEVRRGWKEKYQKLQYRIEEKVHLII